MKAGDGEAKEMGKENVAEKENGKDSEKDKKDDAQTPAKKPTANGGVINGNNATVESGGDVTVGTPTPKGKGKSEGGMISPESLEAT